jgi:hypothetical protein
MKKLKEPKDFITWERSNLEKFAADAFNELEALKEELALAIDAWRDEVKRRYYDDNN